MGDFKHPINIIPRSITHNRIITT